MTWDFTRKVLRHAVFPGPVGALIARVRPYSLFPPLPWGHRLYARLFEGRCRRLEGALRGVIREGERRRVLARGRDNARRLLALLRAPKPRTSDIYEYWRALEDLWDGMDFIPGPASSREL